MHRNVLRKKERKHIFRQPPHLVDNKRIFPNSKSNQVTFFLDFKHKKTTEKWNCR